MRSHHLQTVGKTALLGRQQVSRRSRHAQTASSGPGILSQGVQLLSLAMPRRQSFSHGANVLSHGASLLGVVLHQTWQATLFLAGALILASRKAASLAWQMLLHVQQAGVILGFGMVFLAKKAAWLVGQLFHWTKQGILFVVMGILFLFRSVWNFIMDWVFDRGADEEYDEEEEGEEWEDAADGMEPEGVMMRSESRTEPDLDFDPSVDGLLQDMEPVNWDEVHCKGIEAESAKEAILAEEESNLLPSELWDQAAALRGMFSAPATK
ncbi:MAG: hypothetical protein HQL56_11165 [Magnetococcales bacterium]|nr:hypothetical protein [Magnetococcales bacterium]